MFGNKNRLKCLSNEIYTEFFIDITFKLIPKSWRPYKLFTIATIDFKENKTILIGFILFKNMDSETYLRILKMLNDNFSFNPKVIHTDYESALDKAIKESSFFKNKPINLKCFFHFVKAVRNKIMTIEHNKKGLKKEGINILNNIEIICFIDLSKMDEYKNFLINEIKKYNKYDSLIKYLKSFWFKKNTFIFRIEYL